MCIRYRCSHRINGIAVCAHSRPSKRRKGTTYTTAHHRTHETPSFIRVAQAYVCHVECMPVELYDSHVEAAMASSAITKSMESPKYPGSSSSIARIAARCELLSPNT